MISETTMSAERSIISISPSLRVKDDYLAAWLNQVTIRLRREVCWIWRERTLDNNPLRADNTPDKLFTESGIPELNQARHWEERQNFFETDITAKYLTDKLTLKPGMELLTNSTTIHGSFGWIAKELNLDDASLFVLSLGLAYHFDTALGKVIAICQNDAARTRPTLGLAQKLWDQPEEITLLTDTYNVLFLKGIIQLNQKEPHNNSVSDLDTEITVPSLIANQLLFPHSKIPTVFRILTMQEQQQDHKYSENQNNPYEKIKLISSRFNQNARGMVTIIPIYGQDKSSFIDAMMALFQTCPRAIFEFTGDPRLLQDIRNVNAVCSYCWLKNAYLFLNHDTVTALKSESPGTFLKFIPLISIPITLFLAASDPSELVDIPRIVMSPAIHVPEFTFHQRVSYWKACLGEKGAGLDKAIFECAHRFRIGKASISDICQALQKVPTPLTSDDLINFCRLEVELNLGELAKMVVPRFKQEELILPPKQKTQFQEVLKAMRTLAQVHYEWGTAKAWNESGLSVLFSGPSGSGKTMAAEVLSDELRLPMYKVDLSQVVNKYVGETEKNLKRLFDQAEICDMILFFDEAESIFGHRTDVKDAHDMYANLQVAYLLTRIDSFKGYLILATNRRKDLDEAFSRRLRYIIDFPMPDEKERKMIWKKSIPESIDCSKIDIDFLARQFQLTGGSIRSAIFNACLQSAEQWSGEKKEVKQLTMEAIIVAIKRECEKVGRSTTLDQFGPFAKFVEKL